MTRSFLDSSSLNRDFFARLMKPLGRRGFEALIRPHFLPSEQKKIMQAYRLSKYGHYAQTRQDGVRYFEHPKTLAILLIRLGCRDVDVICSALLHDTIEDSFILELEDIEDWFGAVACMTVMLCTKQKGLGFLKYIARLFAGDPRGMLVKCADRLHNLSTLESDDPSQIDFWTKKKAKQCRETRKHILPMAVKLSQTPGYEAIGQFMVDALTFWVELREREVRLCT